MLLEEQLDVATDVPCVQCGYRLRGLAPTGRCPECGTAITESFRGDPLCFANTEWLNGIRWGVRLLFWADIAWLLLGLPMSVLAAAGRLAVVTWYICSTALSTSYILGLVLFTRQEPRLSLIESAWSWRRTTRCAGILAIIAGLAETAMWYLDTNIGAWAAYILARFTIAIAVLCLFAYVRELAARIPHQRMARSAAILKWLLAATFLLYEGVRTIAATLGSPPAAGKTVSRMTVTEMLTLSAYGAFAVSWIWSCIVFGRCHRALRGALTIARSPQRSAEGVPIARPIAGATKE